MTDSISRKPKPWRGKTAIALFAATAALAGGAQAFAPLPAVAVIAEECDPDLPPAACTDQQGGGERIVIVDSKPTEPKDTGSQLQEPDWPKVRPVSVPVDVGSLLGDALGAGGGGRQSGDRAPKRGGRELHCATQLSALRDAVQAHGKKPIDDAEFAYRVCRSVISLVETPARLANCSDLAKLAAGFARAKEKEASAEWALNGRICEARWAYQAKVSECQVPGWTGAQLDACWRSVDERLDDVSELIFAREAEKRWAEMKQQRSLRKQARTGK
jgi:hypothetical protein